MGNIKGRNLIRQIGPFWPDMIEPGVWGIEAAKQPAGQHYICQMMPMPDADGAFNVAQAICEVLNSVGGFGKVRKP